MQTRNAIIAAALSLALGAAAADIVVLPEEQRRAAFAMEFDVQFAKGAPRHVDLHLFFPDSRWPNATDPSRWRFTKTGINFAAGWTRTLGDVANGYTGTPFMDKGFFKSFDVPDDVKRHAKVVVDEGHVSFFVQFGDVMQRTHTDILWKGFRLQGYRFLPPEGVTVSDIVLRPLDDSDRPQPRDGFEVRRSPGKVAIPVTDGQSAFEFIPGGYPVEIRVDFDDGTTNRLSASFASFCESFEHRLYLIERSDKKGVEEFERGGFGGRVRLPDYGMRFSCGSAGFPIYTLPKLAGRYGAVQTIHMMTNLTAYGENASMHVFDCALVRRRGRNLLYIDGNFAATVGSTGEVHSLSLSLPAGAYWRAKAPPPPEGDPLRVKIPDFEPFATAVCRENMGSFALECDGYLSRGAFERQYDSFLRRVPVGTYLRARVRCRLGGDTNRNTKVTARLTNFTTPNSSGRSPDSITQETKSLPRGLVGETNVVFAFDPGKIQDLIWQKGFRFLDFEVLGDCNRKHSYTDQKYYKPVGRSDVVVLGAELEMAPAGMCVRSGIQSALYWPHEEAFVTVLVEAAAAGRYRVVWEVTDIDGATCENGTEDYDLPVGGRETRRIVFKTRKPGWYKVATRLEDAEGSVILRHDASYVSLAEDTRRAGYESPFFTWTRLRSNNSDTNDFVQVMEHVHRLGIRKAQMGTFCEKDGEKWGVTLSPLPRIDFSSKPTETERMAEYERKIRHQMARFPHASETTIFHESGNCRGRNETPDPKQDAEEIRKATELCTAWRRVAPQVRLVVGNSSLDKIAQILRNKFPRELIDAMGEESTGNAVPPERTVGGVFQIHRELADKYGYTDLPVTPCYEWKSRPARNFTSHRQLAAFRVRDALIALAWGATHVPLEAGFEPASCYFMSSWGAGSFSHRPYGYPYPSAAALATLTRVLDRANYSRLLPTDSESVYAVEFKNADGNYVYALWTPRGTARARIETSARSLLLTGTYGAEETVKPKGGAIETAISEEPAYLTVSKPLKAISTLPVDRQYPFERYPGIADARVVVPFDSLEGVALITNGYPRCPGVKGSFTLKEVDDPVRGRCLELTRRGTTGKDASFGGVRLLTPVLLDGKADTLGVWVKGNSSDGKIYFEIDDATGRRYYSTSHYHAYDWCGKMNLDFDGWRLISFPLTAASPVRLPTPAPDLQNWYGVGGPWAPPKPPVKLRSIGFAWSDTVLHVNALHPAGSQSVRIGNLSVY